MTSKLDYLPVVTLRELHAALSAMTVEQRMEAYGLKADRADVIVPAAEIFLAIADGLKAKRILVPGMDLADGIITEMIAGTQGVR